MNKFNNSEYESMVKDFLGDTFYKETSYRGKIATLRSYAEVIVRKLLNLESNVKMTLGQKDIKGKISLLNNSNLILKSIKTINTDGSNYTHTQKTNEVSKDEFDNVVNSTFDLLSVLLINYFEKYEFGSNASVLSSFSLLPPIIRYKALSALYEKNPTNISVIDKLVLSILKAFNTDMAILWVEERKEVLTNMLAMSDKAFKEISDKQGIDIAKLLWDSAPNMYQMCNDKILQVGNVVEENGVLYSDFESALPFYLAKGVLSGSEPEIVEFNDIMNFLYLGRKEDLIELTKDSDSYIVMNFIL